MSHNAIAVLNSSPEMRNVREHSKAVVLGLGCAYNATLPLLDSPVLRPMREIVDRALVLNCMAYRTAGLGTDEAVQWLQTEGLFELITDEEKNLVFSNTLPEDEGPAVTNDLGESAHTLAWVLGLTFWREFNEPLPDDLALDPFPDFMSSYDSTAFRAKADLRDPYEVVKQCDLAYCLHWAIRQAGLTGGQLPSVIHPWRVISRRKALEWTLSSDLWEDITLDT